MPESPLLGEGLEYLGGELWSLVRPYDIRYPITTKDTEKNTGKTGSCRVLGHEDDLWPVSTAVDNNEELMSPMHAWEQKSIAISWNEREGRCFGTMGSGGWDGRESWHSLQVRIMLSISLSIPGR